MRLRHGREAWRGHAQQHTARAGAGWQAHPSELCRCPARRSRSRLRPRAQLAIIRVFGGAAARAPTCGTYPARTPHRIPARFGWLQRALYARCNHGVALARLRNARRRSVPQDRSDAKCEKTSDPCHLPADLAAHPLAPVEGWGAGLSPRRPCALFAVFSRLKVKHIYIYYPLIYFPT